MVPMLQELSALGEKQGEWLLLALAWTALLVVLVRAVDEVLSRRVAAAWRLPLYGLVVLRLVLPSDWQTPLGLLPGASSSSPSAESASLVTIVPALEPLLVEPTIDPATAVRPARAWALIPLAHGLGVLLLVSWMVLSRRRLQRDVEAARPARPRVLALLPGMGLLEHARLGPAVVGLVRPRIVLPTNLIDELSMKELANILRHEEAHVLRRDPLLASCLQVLLAVLWPVLPLWLAAFRVRQLMEQACDDRALAGGGSEARMAYGETLIAVAAGGAPSARPALGLLPFGAALRSRLRAMRHATRWSRAGQGLVVASTAVLMLLAAGTRPSARETLLDEARRGSAEWSERRVTLDLEDLGLHEALQVIAAEAELHLVLGPGVPNTRVTVVADDVALSRVLDLALRAGGVVAEHVGDELWVSLDPKRVRREGRTKSRDEISVQLGEDGQARFDLDIVVGKLATISNPELLDGEPWRATYEPPVFLRPEQAPTFGKQFQATAAEELVGSRLVGPGTRVDLGEGASFDFGSVVYQGPGWVRFERPAYLTPGQTPSTGQFLSGPGGLVVAESSPATKAPVSFKSSRVEPVPSPLGTPTVMVELQVMQFPSQVPLTEESGVDGARAPFSAVLPEDFSSLGLDIWLGDLETKGRARTISKPRIRVAVGSTGTLESGLLVPVTSVAEDSIEVTFVEASFEATVFPRQTTDGVVVEWAARVFDDGDAEDSLVVESLLDGIAPVGRTSVALLPMGDAGMVAAWVTATLVGD